jgi:hypothetical protein
VLKTSKPPRGLLSKKLVSKELVSKELVSKELFSGSLTAKAVIRSGVIAKSNIPRYLGMALVLITTFVAGLSIPSICADLHVGKPACAFMSKSLVVQAAEQDEQQTVQNTNEELLEGTEFGAVNCTYAGMAKYWSDDIIGNLFQNIVQLIGRWMGEFIDGLLADCVCMLSSYMSDSASIRGLAPALPHNVLAAVALAAKSIAVYAIVLFGVFLRKRNQVFGFRFGNALSGRLGPKLVFTATLLFCWPLAYFLEFQLTNGMVTTALAHLHQSGDLGNLFAAAVKGGLVASIGLLANCFAPLAGSASGGIFLATLGEIVAFTVLVAYLVLCIILTVQLVTVLALKIVQSGILVWQYIFVPLFLGRSATVGAGTRKNGFWGAFLELNLWSVAWVALLCLMHVTLSSELNPAYKIFLCMGFLQLMIGTPRLIARARISPVSEFVSRPIFGHGNRRPILFVGGNVFY